MNTPEFSADCLTPEKVTYGSHQEQGIIIFMLASLLYQSHQIGFHAGTQVQNELSVPRKSMFSTSPLPAHPLT